MMQIFKRHENDYRAIKWKKRTKRKIVKRARCNDDRIMV